MARVALGLALLALSCGPAPAPSPAPGLGATGVRRIRWEAGAAGGEATAGMSEQAPGEAPATARWGPAVVVRHETLERDSSNWSPQAPGVQLLKRDGQPYVELGAGRAEQQVSLTLEGPFDPARFNRVELDACLEGTGVLRLRCLRAGVELAAGPPVQLPSGPELHSVALDLPVSLLDGEPFDRLVIDCPGAARRLDLREMRLVERDVGQRLASLGAWAEFVGQARPATPLVSGHALSGRLLLGRGDRLALAVARPLVLRRGERAARIRLEQRDGESWSVLAESSLADQQQGWVDWEPALELPAGTARERLLRVSLVTPEGAPPQGCLIGPLRAWLPAAERPSVLLITAEDHRADMLGLAFTGTDIDTPALDRLAGDGWLFEDALAACNGPRGALSALLTGRSPRDTLVLDAGSWLGPSAVTLAEEFSRLGWATAAVLGGRDLGPSSGFCQGFDQVSLPSGLQRPAAEVVADALSLAADHGSVPLFLWVHLVDARWPQTARDEDLALYYDLEDDPALGGLRRQKGPVRVLPRPLRGIRDLDWPRARLKGSLTAMDRALGPLLADPRLGRGLRAYVGVTGVTLGENELWFNHLGLSPAVLDVPLLLAGPGLAAGKRVERPVSCLSLANSLLTLAGESGARLGEAPALLDDSVSAARFVVAQGGAAAAVNDGQTELVLFLRAGPGTVAYEQPPRGARAFYLLSEDRWAEHDRFDDPRLAQPQRRATRSLMDWLAAAGGRPCALPGRLSPEQVKQLWELGYARVPDSAPSDPWSLASGPDPTR